ncbi:hypothetical protein L195_g054697, partial [Trifolium pratense]
MATEHSSPFSSVNSHNISGSNRGNGRSNSRRRRRSQSQQYHWSQSPYQQTQFPCHQPLWTAPAYPRQQQWAYPWQSWATPPHMNGQAAMHTSSISP